MFRNAAKTDTVGTQQLEVGEGPSRNQEYKEAEAVSALTFGNGVLRCRTSWSAAFRFTTAGTRSTKTHGRTPLCRFPYVTDTIIIHCGKKHSVPQDGRYYYAYSVHCPEKGPKMLSFSPGATQTPGNFVKSSPPPTLKFTIQYVTRIWISVWAISSKSLPWEVSWTFMV